MPLSLRQRLVRIAVVAVPFGLYGWAILVATGIGHNGQIGPGYNAVGQDWMIFWTAGHAWWSGQVAHIYDQVWLTRTMDAAFRPLMNDPMPFPGFHYPPTFLLFLVPFAGLPMAWGFAASQLASFAGMVAGLRRAFAEKAHVQVAAASLLLAPAASNNVLSGQNGFLVCALFLAGFPLLEAQPLAAGLWLGLASFKPQICLMIPFALLGARNWRAMAGVAASAAGLALLSLIVFGPEVWQTWLGLMLHPRQDVAYTGVDWGRLWDDSVFTCAQTLGAGKSLANLCQAAATLAAGAAVYASFRRPLSADLRFTIFLTASVVGSPHVSPYDMILTALAATLLVVRSFEAPFSPLGLAIPMLAWLIPLIAPPRVTPMGLAAPAVMFALMAAAFFSGDRRPDRGSPSRSPRLSAA